MPGRLTIASPGRLSVETRDGDAERSPWPVQVRVDAQVVGASQDERRPGDKSGLELPAQAFDGKLHLVSARRLGRDITGSPAIWEPPAPAYDQTDTFRLEQKADAPARRLSGPRLACAAEQDGAVIWDLRSLDRQVVGRRRRLAQNKVEIGGLPGHRMYRPWPAYLAVFKDHHVDALYGGVYRPDGSLWQGSRYLSNTLAQAAARELIRSGPVGRAPAPRCLSFCNSVRDTYFHWHLDCLAGLVMARAMADAPFTSIAPPLNAWQRASLDLLREEVVEMQPFSRPAETLVPCHIDGRAIYPDRWVTQMFEQLRRGHARRRRPSGRGARKLFISRADAGQRVLANEDELWRALEIRGFTRFVPGAADYASQIDAFAQADVIVASHGSALTNMGFCRRDARIIEILPSNYVNGCFRYLAVALGLHHYWFASDLVDPFAVDVKAFMTACSDWGGF